MNGARNTSPAYPVSQTLSKRDTAFLVDQPNDLQSEGHIVGDLNGDTIDDVATVDYDPAKPIEVGIFFGKPGGYTSTLDYTQADVRMFGEVDFTGPYSWTPGVAINPPGLFDVNGDGIGDLLIGDPNVNRGVGRAYLLLGRRTWPDDDQPEQRRGLAHQPDDDAGLWRLGRQRRRSRWRWLIRCVDRCSE